jgi:hypothetical protein
MLDACNRDTDSDTLRPTKVTVKRRLGKTAIALGVVVAVLLALPFLTALASTATSLAMAAVQFAGLLLLFLGIPFLLWVLAKPLYRTFLMPTVRAIHIRKIRANRELMEAALREKHRVRE